MVKISLIVPVYNVEQYLKECLDSIANQSLKDIEIICIDDGSTDNSLAILNEYSLKDDRFIVISQENQGQGIARNKGVDIAKGEYLFFVDPDDWIAEGALEKLYKFAKENSANVVKFNYREYNDYSGKYESTSFAKHIMRLYGFDLMLNPVYNWRQFKKGCLINLDLHVWTYLYSRDFINKNNIRFAPTRRGEDHLFSDGAILLTDKIYYLNKYFYFYRCRKGSAVNTQDKYNLQVFDNINMMKEFLIKHSLYEELEEEFIAYAKQVLLWHYWQNPKDVLEEYKRRSREYFPTDKEFKKFQSDTQKKFIHQIFSVKRRRIMEIKYLIITILGMEILIKPRKRRDDR
jgi:glycosyltransferase involved in cell wall biosynthesis